MWGVQGLGAAVTELPQIQVRTQERSNPRDSNTITGRRIFEGVGLIGVTINAGTRVEQRHPSPAYRVGFAGVRWKRKTLGHTSPLASDHQVIHSNHLLQLQTPYWEKLVFYPVGRTK